MRIFFFVDYWPMPLGGMETHAYEYIKYIREHTNHDLEIIGFSNEITSTIIKHKLTIFPKITIHSPNKLIHLLHTKKFSSKDILFFNSLYWIEIFESIVSIFPETRIVLRSGGNDISQSHILSKGNTCIQRRKYVVDVINRYVETLIINSEYVRKRFLRFGIMNSKLYISQGGVDIQRFKPLEDKSQIQKLRTSMHLKESDCVLLTVCRLMPFKGINYLLEARSLLSAKDKYIHLIVGNGPELETLQDYATELGLENNTHFIGNIDIKDMHLLYQVADVYSHTPIRKRIRVPGGSYIHTETMGRSFCEALVTGIPVVATSVGGVPEIVTNKENGILVPPKNIKKITSALQDLVRSPDMRRIMGINGYTQRERFAWKTLFNEYEKLIYIKP